MSVQTAPALGATEIFVPAERHYPKGFEMSVDDGVRVAVWGKDRVLRVLRAKDAAAEEQAKAIRWDEERQRVIVERWVGEAGRRTMTVYPIRSSTRFRSEP